MTKRCKQKNCIQENNFEKFLYFIQLDCVMSINILQRFPFNGFVMQHQFTHLHPNNSPSNLAYANDMQMKRRTRSEV